MQLMCIASLFLNFFYTFHTLYSSHFPDHGKLGGEEGRFRRRASGRPRRRRGRSVPKGQPLHRRRPSLSRAGGLGGGVAALPGCGGRFRSHLVTMRNPPKTRWGAANTNHPYITKRRVFRLSHRQSRKGDDSLTMRTIHTVCIPRHTVTSILSGCEGACGRRHHKECRDWV